jgi:hypothetical protein
MTRVVQVVLGSSAPLPGGGKTFTVRDFLSCGPLGPVTNLREWRTARKRYWASAGSNYDGDLFADPKILRGAEKVVLWLGTETADQIALAWLPAFLSALGVTVAEIEVIQFERNARGIEIVGIGMLSPTDLAAHPPAYAITADHLAELDVVWRAVTAPEPSALVAYARSASSRFPFLPRALREFLMRYPDATSGVNAWERRVLQIVLAAGPKASRVIGDTLSAGFDELDAGTGGVDHVGDVWLFDRMLRLGDPELKEPALTITGSRSAYLFCDVRLTPFGRRVLDGEANFVDANGIDDWVGGVHLQSDAGGVWFHRDGNLIRR